MTRLPLLSDNTGFEKFTGEMISLMDGLHSAHLRASRDTVAKVVSCGHKRFDLCLCIFCQRNYFRLASSINHLKLREFEDAASQR